MNEEKEIERFCKICDVSNHEARFRKSSRVCLKCASKRNNERLKLKNYYSNYYNENKEKIISNTLKNYYEAKASKPHIEKKLGRPPKKAINNDI